MRPRTEISTLYFKSSLALVRVETEHRDFPNIHSHLLTENAGAKFNRNQTCFVPLPPSPKIGRGWTTNQDREKAPVVPTFSRPSRRSNFTGGKSRSNTTRIPVHLHGFLLLLFFSSARRKTWAPVTNDRLPTNPPEHYRAAGPCQSTLHRSAETCGRNGDPTS